MVCGDCCTTVICSVDLRLPAFLACCRRRCTEAITSACWLKDASPSDDVHARLLAIWSSTEGNCVSAFTLGSQGWPSTAFIKASPCRFLLLLTKLSAAWTWSG